MRELAYCFLKISIFHSRGENLLGRLDCRTVYVESEIHFGLVERVSLTQQIECSEYLLKHLKEETTLIKTSLALKTHKGTKVNQYSKALHSWDIW